MKKCYLDTNILLYFTNPVAQFHEQTVELISHLSVQDWTLFIIEPEYLAAGFGDEWFDKNFPKGILRSLLRSSSFPH